MALHDHAAWQQCQRDGWEMTAASRISVRRWLCRHRITGLDEDVLELISMLPWMVALVAAAAAVNTKH
jgi:hypothetical protein